MDTDFGDCGIFRVGDKEVLTWRTFSKHLRALKVSE